LAIAASKTLGQPVVVDNRPGAGGTLAAATLAQSGSSDGYTIAVAPATLFKVPHMQKVPYDPMKQLSYLMGFSAYTFALVVPAASPWTTLAEFTAHAKANPDKISVGTTGLGSSGHMAIATLAQQAGIALNVVPFKGGAEVLQAFVGGHINAALDGGWAQIERQAKGRVLAAFTDKRLARLPNVPTARELGIDMVAASPIGLVAPRNIDPQAAATLHDAFKAALADPSYLQNLETFDLENAYLSGAEYFQLASRLWVEERRYLQALGLLAQP
ncbi:MAG TPA: tripartite tricarboxylate transporter substrate binding protein, partial [Pseudorhodoferax sp.]|nr:tripartite tricarboxylate transporter substrate binding protein [Pseudorhodoferax sp.]